jgi:hypothetical protein
MRVEGKGRMGGGRMLEWTDRENKRKRKGEKEKKRDMSCK